MYENELGNVFKKYVQGAFVAFDIFYIRSRTQSMFIAAMLRKFCNVSNQK